MILSESYILYVQFGVHHENVSVGKYDFLRWIENLKKEFSVYNTIEVDEHNSCHIHKKYYLVNYHDHLDLIGTCDIFNEPDDAHDDLPFA